MPASNEEKYLKSIDGTLKDILKELKRQNRVEVEPVKIAIHSEKLSKNPLEDLRNKLARDRLNS